MKWVAIGTGLVTLVVAAGPLSAQRIEGDAWRLGRLETGFGASAWNYSPTTNMFLSALRRDTLVAPFRLEPVRPDVVRARSRGPQDIAAAESDLAVDSDPILPTTTVPEPATMALLATGLLLLGAMPAARRLRNVW